MEEQRYNNRQVERLLDQQSTDLKEYIKLSLDPILEQTKKTNGRVTALEKQSAKHGTYIRAGAWIVSAAWALILAIVGSFSWNKLY